ncbi:MAG TPA: putative glycoside hydrolase [Gaiellales bacterium]|jgi:hypothetical protein|nr:putative glycoside hydrolase [Gaiellales bacterium]
MRRLLIGAAALLAAAACSGTPPPTPSACAGAVRPAVPLTIRLTRVPGQAQAVCIAKRYSSVFAGSDSWGKLPTQMKEVNPNIQLWLNRSLLYACDDCQDAVFSVAYIRRHHPEWIMHTATGEEIHPLGHPDKLLLDFTSYDYEVAWGERVVSELDQDGFTGVNVVDAGNLPLWDGVPVVRNRDVPARVMDDASRSRQLAKALSVVKAVLGYPNAYRLAAYNGPPDIVHPNQIDSVDAVQTGGGFAALDGAAWAELFNYFHVAFERRTGAVVWDDGQPMTADQRLYGLAGYLLVATPFSVYGPGSRPGDPLYRIPLGPADQGEPIEQDGAWVRDYENGSVAVNPGPSPVHVSMGAAGTVRLAPETAAISVGSRVIHS